MLYPHKAALALQAEISLPGEAAREIPKKKSYEQRLESGGFLSRCFFKESGKAMLNRGYPHLEL